MLYLKVAKLIRDLTDTPPHALKAVKFGIDLNYTAGSAGVAASQYVPEEEALLVFRVQSYLVDITTTDAGYLAYRAVPRGVAYWLLGLSVSDVTGVFQVTSQNAPTQLALDCDEMLLFPPSFYANLIVIPTTAPPETGSWYLRTTCFAFLIPPSVYEALGGSTDWLNVQQ